MVSGRTVDEEYRRGHKVHCATQIESSSKGIHRNLVKWTSPAPVIHTPAASIDHRSTSWLDPLGLAFF